MHVSAIVSTYNAPDWLEKVMWGYACQQHGDFEIIIADDGSTIETMRRLERVRKQTGLPLRHIWQPDDGFNKCGILNKAILAARYDYLVFSDGDCIPRRDFLRQHVQLAQRGYFLSGGAVRLPRALSLQITSDDVRSSRCVRARWLLKHGFKLQKQVRMVLGGPWLGRCLDSLTTTRATFNGCNASAWKADVLRVNGFDERMKYGGEDRELGERLCNIGVRAKQVRHRAICVHLDHDRPYLCPQALERNRAIRAETRVARSTWTQYGIQQGTIALAATAPHGDEDPDALPFPCTAAQQSSRRAA